MKTRLSFRRISRITAALVLAATLATWVATGAHRGWTRTTITKIQQDEITGIEYPVQHPGFVAGVEVLAVGVAAAALLAGISLVRRPRNAQAA